MKLKCSKQFNMTYVIEYYSKQKQPFLLTIAIQIMAGST